MTKQVIVMRKDLNMRKGKIAAQAAHASLGVFSKDFNYIMDTPMSGKRIWADITNDMYLWFQTSFKKICVSVDNEQELIDIFTKAEEQRIPCILITDNGDTEFNGVPTKTCCAIGPAKSEVIDSITGHLRLL